MYSENGILEGKVRDFCNKSYDKGCRSPHLMSCLIDLLDADEKSKETENIEKVQFALKVYAPIYSTHYYQINRLIIIVLLF